MITSAKYHNHTKYISSCTKQKDSELTPAVLFKTKDWLILYGPTTRVCVNVLLVSSLSITVFAESAIARVVLVDELV